MSFVIVIEIWRDLPEVGEDFVMARHICRQNAPDDALADRLVILALERLENVAVFVFEYSESYATMVVFQRRDVVITDR